jgi:hypothetical protein
MRRKKTTAAVRSVRSAALFALLIACADEGVVGENEVESADGSVSVSRAPDADPCVRREMRSDLPLFASNYPVAPALWVEMARGTWSNATGDVLEVHIADANTQVERTCYDATTPHGSVPLPEVTFELEGEITLRTTDGAWNETVTTSFGLSLGPQTDSTSLRTLLSGAARVPFAQLQGTFKLPSDSPKLPANEVRLDLAYQNLGWVVSRSVLEDRTLPDGGIRPAAGLPGDVWRDQLVFVKR